MTVKHSLIAAVAAATAFAAMPAGAQDAKADLARAASGPQFVPGEVLVKFRPGTAAADKAAARGRASAVGTESVTTAVMRQLGVGDLELVRLPAGMSVARAMGQLEAHFAVEYAEPNWIYYHDAVSNDTYYTNGSLWGMYGDSTTPANQYGSGAARRGRRARPIAPASTSASSTKATCTRTPTWRRTSARTRAKSRQTASTTTATATSTTSTAGTSTATTTRSSTAPATTTARTSPAPSAASAATATAWPACAGASRCIERQVPRPARRHHRQRHQGGRLLHRPQDAPRPQHRRHQQLLGRRRLFAGAAGRHRARQHRRHPVHRRGRQQHAATATTTPLLPVEYPNANVIAVASITSTGAISFLELRRDDGRPRRPGSGIWSTRAGELQGQRRAGLRAATAAPRWPRRT